MIPSHISSGLPPWEAPVMIAEKRKLFFSFSFHSHIAFLLLCRSDCDWGGERLDFQCHEPHLAHWNLHLCCGPGGGH